MVERSIAPSASEVDRTGAFPEHIDALAGAAVLGLLSASEVAGGSLADVAVTLERIARADASVAMVVLMHYAAVSVIESHGPDDVRREIGRRGDYGPGLPVQPVLGARRHGDRSVVLASSPIMDTRS